MAEWRYIAQRLPSNQFIEWNVPLSDVEITTSLSGPGRLTGTVPVELARMKGPDGRPLFDEWGTAIWAEADGQIRGGGILVQSDFEDGEWRLDCMGYSGYPKAMPWLGAEKAYIQVDPLNIVRDIWAHLQSQPNGNLGVIVDKTTSPARVGQAPDKPASSNKTSRPAQPDPSIADGPYQLNWWSTDDLGGVVDDLATSAPFDYMEQDAWSGDRIEHRLRLFYPATGRRRTDLRFVVGENIAIPPAILRGGTDYADEVLVRGAGEGREQIRAHEAKRGARLRRATVLSLKGVTSASLAVTEAKAELAYRTGAETVDTVEVTDHPHAPLGSYQVGDEILLQGDTGWFDLDMWVRIIELTIRPEDKSSAVLTVARSEVAK